MKNEITTLKELIYWSYANLAMAHAAITDCSTKYTRKHFMIRSRLYKGLRNGTISIRSTYFDEKIKLSNADKCAYCKSPIDITIDHLIPRASNGHDSSDNLLPACKHCNSSKGKKDLFEWYKDRGIFPPILIIRRYLKLLLDYALTNDLIDCELSDSRLSKTPFRIDLIPTDYPQPDKLELL